MGSLLGLVTGGISSVLTGGVTGLLGVVLQRFADYKNKQLDIQLENQRAANELARMDKEATIAAAEWAAKMEIKKVETAGASDVADSQAFAASFAAEPQRYAVGEAPKGVVGVVGWFVLTLVDALRGSIRPLLTVYLCVIATKLYWDAHRLLGDGNSLTNEQALIIVSSIIDTILYLWVTCTTWWFGTRNKQEPPKR